MSRPAFKTPSRRQLEVLQALRLWPNASLGELATMLGCSRTNVVQLVRSLRASGHVLTTTRALSRKGDAALDSAVADLREALASVG